MPLIDILLATYNRPQPLVMTLSGIVGQTFTDMRLIVADQSDESTSNSSVVQTLCRVIEAHGIEVNWHDRPQVHGIAEQRHFLLTQAAAPYVLYLDDDVLMEPWVVQTLLEALQQERCAFVGAFPAGLSYQDDYRPEQHILEYWTGPVQPEAVEPGSAAWERWQLHRAANLHHAAADLPPGQHRLYKIAWISCCILYDRARLEEVGGFSFWSRLPRYHSGEEVLVQNLLMRRWGGCGLIPSGTYHAEVPSTVLNDAGAVDGHALDLLPEMVAQMNEAAS